MFLFITLLFVILPIASGCTSPSIELKGRGGTNDSLMFMSTDRLSKKPVGDNEAQLRIYTRNDLDPENFAAFAQIASGDYGNVYYDPIGSFKGRPVRLGCIMEMFWSGDDEFSACVMADAPRGKFDHPLTADPTL